MGVVLLIALGRPLLLPILRSGPQPYDGLADAFLSIIARCLWMPG
ncbi:hypothetical protein [Streptomyces sp. NBC_01497]|nr:hypothetical protein [Streptomyces sp. NBC_01497]